MLLPNVGCVPLIVLHGFALRMQVLGAVTTRVSGRALTGSVCL